ncbi:hypothetical protein, partial [Salmonella sp. s54836]|uniref:hypothetical protein n=1 Tax=Salmonella sp. s54836 TaxID=3159673 RepID=UPI003980CAE8
MEPVIPEKFAAKDYFTALFQKSKFDSYIGHENQDTFFTDAQRSLIVYNILMDTNYSAKSNKVGLDRVISKGTYSSAFPIHDGNYFLKPKEEP